MICVVYSRDAARSAIFTYRGIDLHAKVGGLLLLGEFHDEFATFAVPAQCGSDSAVDDSTSAKIRVSLPSSLTPVVSCLFSLGFMTSETPKMRSTLWTDES